MQNLKRKNRKNKTLKVLLVLLVGLLITLIMGTVVMVKVMRDLPSPDEFETRRVNESTKIYDKTGKVLLYEIHGEEKRTVVPFEEIPDVVKKSTLAAENDSFYQSPAFDWKAIMRALIINLKSGRIAQGGSTITQQLAKNLFLTREKTLIRKIKELVLAIELESKYSKDEILSLYLNQIPYGSNAYGVEAASLMYFGKSAKEVSLAEAAILASLLQAPSYYSPWGNNVKELMNRKNYILDRMIALNFTQKEDGEAAKQSEITFAPPSLGIIKAPHFSLTVKEELINRFGEDRVMNGGLRVITTLNWSLQELAEKVVKEGAKRNQELYKGTNAALIAEDSNTGQILALVGSRDYFDKEIEGRFNVPLQGLRQPGSALKPFVYLTAFEKGYTPKTILFDVPTEFDASGIPERSYKPENFDNNSRGPIMLEESLAQSINVTAVKTLYLAGMDNVLKNVQKFGLETLKERGRYGLSLVLGGGEVKLIDLVEAYSVLAEEGVHHKQITILKIEDSKGNIIDEHKDETERVMEPQYPRMITQILSDKRLRAPLFQNSLNLTVFPDQEVALKTGTTNDYRDAWTLGYTPSLVVGVWAGNNSNEPMQKQGGSILAAIPIWNAFLKEALKSYKPEVFERPEPSEASDKPVLNGEAIYTPIVNGKPYPQIHSILYYINKADPLGNPPEDPLRDSQFENWEKGIMEWARTNIPNFGEYNQPIPGESSFGTSSLSSADQNIVITNNIPKNGEFINSPFVIRGEITSDKNLKKIEAFLNQEKVGSVETTGKKYFYQFSINKNLNPQNILEIKITTDLDKETVFPIILYH